MVTTVEKQCPQPLTQCLCRRLGTDRKLLRSLPLREVTLDLFCLLGEKEARPQESYVRPKHLLRQFGRVILIIL